MASWIPRLTVVLVGFTGGVLAFSATHDSPNRQSCQAWKKITTAIVEDTEDLAAGDASAEGTLGTAAYELDHDAENYPHRYYRTHSPSVEASDELLHAAEKLAAKREHGDGLQLLHNSIADFTEVCR
jgi:hypothetical protein